MARLSAFRGQVRPGIRILRKAPLVPGCRWPCCPGACHAARPPPRPRSGDAGRSWRAGAGAGVVLTAVGSFGRAIRGRARPRMAFGANPSPHGTAPDEPPARFLTPAGAGAGPGGHHRGRALPSGIGAVPGKTICPARIKAPRQRLAQRLAGRVRRSVPDFKPLELQAGGGLGRTTQKPL